MPEISKKTLQEAQKRFERDSETARAERQKVFAEAHAKGGFSYSEIAESVGLSKSRVEQIIKGV